MAITLDGTVGINTSGSLTTGTGAIYDSIQSSESIATTSGTSVSFTSIPSWVKRITLILDKVSLSSGGQLLVKLGTSGGIVSTGYDSTSALVLVTPEVQTNTTGLVVALNADGRELSGMMTIALLTTNRWMANHCFRSSNTAVSFGGGGVNIGGTLTQIQLVPTTGNFDQGTASILYE